MKTEFVNRLSVPMRKEDNDALSEVRSALEKRLGKRLSNSETVRIMLKTLQVTIPQDSIHVEVPKLRKEDILEYQK